MFLKNTLRPVLLMPEFLTEMYFYYLVQLENSQSSLKTQLQFFFSSNVLVNTFQLDLLASNVLSYHFTLTR